MKFIVENFMTFLTKRTNSMQGISITTLDKTQRIMYTSSAYQNQR
jgi:hypothetical protein